MVVGLAQGDVSGSTNFVWVTSLIEQVRGDQAAFYHSDNLGSVKALSNAFGTAKDAGMKHPYPACTKSGEINVVHS